MSKPVKQCEMCGTTHTPDGWAALHYVGLFDVRDEAPEEPVLELRNCGCGTTLSIEIQPVKQ